MRRLALLPLALLTLLLAAAPGYSGDAPEISRARGDAGGVVVLWTRIIPATDDPAVHELARAVQDRLRAAASEAAPGATIDVRPEPERVCPRGGCKALALGAVLAHKEGGCVAVATVSAPGESAQKLVPWGGQVQLLKPEVPFREPPESSLRVADFVRCTDLAAELDRTSLALKQAITAGLGS